MKKIDKSAYEKRLSRISDIFHDIAIHADQQALSRCPYKNRFDRCTATFGCRYKRRSRADGELPVCTSDDRLDYRSAWQADPDGYARMRDTLQTASSHRHNNGNQAMAQVTHEGETVPSETGKTLFDYADQLQVQVPTSCGRSGHCHECIVQIKRGGEALSKPSEAEAFLRGDYRLACQAVVEDPSIDVEFALPRRSPKILTSQTYREVELDPAVKRRGQSVYYGDELIDQYHGHIYGLAVDVGTTTVVVELVDLETGRSIYVISFENPQRFGGSDIMNRISYDAGPYQGELHRAIINTLNTEIQQMCAALDIDRREIYELAVVGNSTMRDLVFNLNVQSIGQKPYKSLVEEEYLAGKRPGTSLIESARKLRIQVNKNARVWAAPLIASHVGGDVAADLMAIDILSQSDTVMLLDVGTNSEVILGNKDHLIAASCPAGPAFEGGLVKFGMPGCEGAIESLRYVDGQFDFTTIGNLAPQGICGSGLIDLLAELRRHQRMTPKSVFAEKAKEFSIVPEHGITFSRQDASHLAQAKAANYCGQMILMRKAGITPQHISKLYLAGGFANYVNVANAIEIGFLAPVPEQRIEKVGNAAAQGARELLLSRARRESLERLVKRIEHVELETTPDFFDIFVEGCQFKPMRFSETPPL